MKQYAESLLGVIPLQKNADFPGYNRVWGAQITPRCIMVLIALGHGKLRVKSPRARSASEIMGSNHYEANAEK